MKVKPLADRVLVKTEKLEAKTAGGIIIPDTAQEKTQTAIVVAVGDDKEKIKVSAGQKVMFEKYAGTPVKIDGEERLPILEQEGFPTYDMVTVIDEEKCDRCTIQKSGKATTANSHGLVQIVILPKHSPKVSVNSEDFELKRLSGSFFLPNTMLSVTRTQSGSNQSMPAR